MVLSVSGVFFLDILFSSKCLSANVSLFVLSEDEESSGTQSKSFCRVWVSLTPKNNES